MTDNEKRERNKLNLEKIQRDIQLARKEGRQGHVHKMYQIEKERLLKEKVDLN